MRTFKPCYFITALIILITEVLIALYVHDTFIRPYVGDFLVVILIYCFVRAFFTWPVIATALGVLLFSYAVEVLQYFKIVNILCLQDITFARIIIGTDFAWADMLAYTLGIAFVLLVEKLRFQKHDIVHKETS